MVAIAAHNIPEGAAVASPIYHSTKRYVNISCHLPNLDIFSSLHRFFSKWQAFKYCLLSGICEPLGAAVFGVFFSQYMNDYVVKSLLAGGTCTLLYFPNKEQFLTIKLVAGIMVLVSLRELLPTALKYMTAEVRSNNKLLDLMTNVNSASCCGPLLVCSS